MTTQPRAPSHLTRGQLWGLALGCLFCSSRVGALELSHPFVISRSLAASSSSSQAPSFPLSGVSHSPQGCSIPPLPSLCLQSRKRGPDILLHISTNPTQIFPRDGSAGHCMSRASPAAGWWGRPPGCPCPSLGLRFPSVAVHLAALGCPGKLEPLISSEGSNSSLCFSTRRYF